MTDFFSPSLLHWLIDSFVEGRKVASEEVSESKAADLGNKTCYQPTSSFPQICQRERERKKKKKERKRERESINERNNDIL